MIYTTFTALLQGAKSTPDYAAFVESHPTTPKQKLLQIWRMRTDMSTDTVMRITYTDSLFWHNRYGIPQSTLRCWRTGKRLPTDYLLRFIASDLLTDQGGPELTYTSFSKFLSNATHCTSPEEFISTYEHSFNKKILRDIWDLSRDPTVPCAMAATYTTRIALHRRYGIPLRTVAAWISRSVAPADYIFRFIATDLLQSAYTD